VGLPVIPLGVLRGKVKKKEFKKGKKGRIVASDATILPHSVIIYIYSARNNETHGRPW